MPVFIRNGLHAYTIAPAPGVARGGHTKRAGRLAPAAPQPIMALGRWAVDTVSRASWPSVGLKIFSFFLIFYCLRFVQTTILFSIHSNLNLLSHLLSSLPPPPAPQPPPPPSSAPAPTERLLLRGHPPTPPVSTAGARPAAVLPPAGEDGKNIKRAGD